MERRFVENPFDSSWFSVCTKKSVPMLGWDANATVLVFFAETDSREFRALMVCYENSELFNSSAFAGYFPTAVSSPYAKEISSNAGLDLSKQEDAPRQKKRVCSFKG